MFTLAQSSTFVAISLTVLFVYKRLFSKGNAPPGPSSWPFIGNMEILKELSSTGNMISVFDKLRQKYGPIAQFEMMGQRHVVLSSEQACHDLFVKRGSIYSGRGIPYTTLQIVQNVSPALMPKNDAWRRIRKLLHSSISIAINSQYQELMDTEATVSVGAILENPSNYRDELLRYSYSVIGSAFFGLHFTSAEDPQIVKAEKFVSETLETFRPDRYPANIFPFLRYLPHWLVTSLRKMNNLKQDNLDVMQSQRQRVEEQIEKKTETLGTYREFLENRDKYEATDFEADSAFMALYGAGTRSGHNGLLGFLILMMKYPEWQQKLQAEIDHVVGPNRLPNWDDIPHLPTVRAVVKEGVRYRSIVAELGVPHKLDQDDVYEGIFFKKDTIFHSNFPAILMDKTMYPDQEIFNPARWLEPSYPTYKEPLTVYPNCQNFASFGYGRRACPGYDFAERSLIMMVAQLAWGCDIRAPIDPATEKPCKLDIVYEMVPNPRPLPFPCEITPRSESRTKVVKSVIKKAGFK